MTIHFQKAELAAYLDEALPVEAMAQIEQALRADRRLADQLTAILAERDSGACSLGEIWRRHRLSCPSRQELHAFRLGALAEDAARYIRFHLEAIGCRYCEANMADLENRQVEPSEAAETRRRKCFQSSAGHLRR
jgi:hypothetical protein